MDPAQSSSDNRQIRVFISSTFRDMMREREHLVPSGMFSRRDAGTRRADRDHRPDLVFSSLRLSASARDPLIRILGERYGWIPDTIRPEVIAREPWLRNTFRDAPP